MKKFLLFFAAVGCWGQSVAIYSTDAVHPNQDSTFLAPSHSSVAVTIQILASGVNLMRAHSSVPGGTCTSGTVSAGERAVLEGTQPSFSLNYKRRYAWQGPTDEPYPFTHAVFTGLQPGQRYQLCPEVSTDNGSTWSSGVGVYYTTPAAGAIHPNPPEAPVDFPTAVPAENTALGIPPATPCSGVNAAIKAAQGNQNTTPAVIAVDPTVTCDSLTIDFANSPDLIPFNASGINLTNNTININNTVGGSIPSGVPVLTEGQGIRFAPLDTYHNTWPSHIFFNTTASNQALPYVFYVHFPNAGDTNNFQLYYPQPFSQCSTCLYSLGTVGTNGSGTHEYFYEFPRHIHQIILRTATPDNQFVPEHVRVTPQWDSKMAHFRNLKILSQYNGDGNQQPGEGNIRFLGLKISEIPMSQSMGGDSFNPPLNNGTGIYAGLASSDWIFDRCWIHGPDKPDRVNNMMTFDGANMAMVDSYMDSYYIWTPTSTWEGYAPNLGVPLSTLTTINTRSFSVGPGEIHGGNFNYKQTGTMTVTLSGTPTSSTGGLIYSDINGNAFVAIPSGMSATTNIGTVTTAKPRSESSCEINRPSDVLPLNTGGYVSVAPIACFFVNSDGTMNGLYRFQVATIAIGQPGGSWGGEASSNTVIAGRGSGPMHVENTYFAGSGLFWHQDDCISGYPSSYCMTDLQNYTFRRNYWLRPDFTLMTSPNWDGLIYQGRQMLEFKHGNHILISGNIFDGDQGCSNQENTGTTILTKTSVFDSVMNDIKISSNIVKHGCGIASFGSFYDGAAAMARWEFTNNLVYMIDGWRYNDYTPAQAYQGGVGWLFEGNGGSEDLNISHNTFLDQDGRRPEWIDWQSTGNEGFTMNNNLLFFSSNSFTSGGMNAGASGQDFDNREQPYCGGLFQKALLDCATTNYSFKNNVIVPGWQSQAMANNCGNGGTDTSCRTSVNVAKAGNQHAGQTSYSTIASAYSGLPSNTVLNQTSGVPAAIAAVKMINPTDGGNFRFRNDSALISGGQYHASDGTDVGANMDKLDQELGVVTLVGVPASSITSSAATISFVAPDQQGCPVDISSSDPNVVASFTRFADSGTSNRVRTISLSGLQSQTTYHYRVNCAVYQPMGVFRTH